MTGEDPVVAETVYENSDKTVQTIVGSTAKPFVAIYYGSTNFEKDIQVWTLHGVFSGTAGDLTNTGPEDLNGIDLTITGILTTLTITVDATAYLESIILTGAAVVISAD